MRLAHRVARSVRTIVVAAGLAISAKAQATWSIIIVDTRTGEIAIGSATCLSGFDLELNASIVVPGIGAAAAQSFVDQTGQNRVFIHDHMLRGTNPGDIIKALAGFDSGHQTRQYGIVDLRDDGRAVTFTGTGAGQYRGGRTGRVVGAGPTGGDLVYAVQGNVLTGQPVIDAAVAAIESAPGDVPEKLMRAMEEAMRMGGDGRCSCTPGNPTGCGAPPPNFIRTAYIGYMIVSRDGDRRGCNGLYRLNASTPSAIVAVDLNRDGAPDLVTCNQASSSVTVLSNTIGSGWATYGLPMGFTVGQSPRDIVAADFSGDGFADIATANFNTDNVTVLRAQANGSLIGRVDVATGDGCIALIAGDFDGDGDNDIAAANQISANIVILANDGAGAFTNVRTVPLAAAPTSLAAGDLDGDGDQDIVAAIDSMPNSGLVILRNTTPEGGAADFTTDAPLGVGRGVSAVAIARLNADDRADIAAVAATDSQINVLLQGDAGFDPPANLAFAGSAIGLVIADVNDDEVVDLVSASRLTPQRFGYLAGRGDGTFEAARFFNMNLTPGKFTLADLNVDGSLDFAAPLTSNSQALTSENFGGGLFTSGAGCASGDYWMNLNVANVPSGAPDPVPVLRSQFDNIRSKSGGITDAIRSGAAFEPAGVRADGVNTAQLVVTLRDWLGTPVSGAGSRTVQVVHGDADLGTEIGPVTLEGDGTYGATITSGTTLGTAEFRVLVQDGPGARRVQLMPSSELSLLHLADWDLSGSVNSADFFDFLKDFFNDGADFNHDGVVNSQDFFEYLAAFFTG